MGLAQRAQRIVDERARQRYAERDAAERQRQAEADAHHAAFLDRERAAEYLGISTHKLKRLMAAGTGPACIKSGLHKQSPVVWALAELQAWKADLRGYNAARNATSP
jgi:predicted DNA-binding transcriptional regulator AlpA